MAEQQTISRSEFWLGVATVLASVFATLWSTCWQAHNTRAEIRASYDEADRTRLAESLANLTTAVNDVCAALQAHGSMYVEIRNCMTKRPSDRSCWTKDHDFDLEASQNAWNQFDTQVARSRVVFTGKQESQAFESLRRTKLEHMRQLRVLLRAPESIATADAAIQLMHDTESSLRSTVQQLGTIAAGRVRKPR